jgi:radical SAM protein with 4Fe4S-binding SPASM domain
MKLKPFIEINIDNRWFVLPKIRQAKNCIVEMNDTGHFFLSELACSKDVESIVESTLCKYGLPAESRSQIFADLTSFINNFKASALIETEDEFDDSSVKPKVAAMDLGFLHKYDLLQKGFSAKMRPFKFFIELTYNCNLRCMHCYKTEDVFAERTEQVFFATEKVFNLLDQIELSGAVEVYFTGGEVFTHPDIFEILTYASKKRFLTTVLTNGNYLCKETQVQKLAGINLFDIRVSIYGNEQTHDAMTRVHGSYKKSTEALKNIKKVLGIGTAVYVVTSDNFHAREAVFAFCEENDLNLSISTSIFPTVEGELFPTRLRISPEQYRLLAEERQINLIGSSCTAGIGRFRVTPTGDINPCELMRGDILGNVFSSSLNSILGSEKRCNFARRFTEIHKNHSCNKCSLRKHCNYCPALFILEAGDVNTPPKHLCSITQQKYELYTAAEESVKR